jgi:hypothetical protein
LQARTLLANRATIKALDIGAGLGKAMKAMERAGFDVHGIEPSATFREKCLTRTGIPADRLQLARVEDAAFPEAGFDFVSFGAVLERPSRRSAVVAVPGEQDRQRLLPAAGRELRDEPQPDAPSLSSVRVRTRSFRMHGARVGYEIATHRYYVCAIPHLPRILHAPLRKWMARTDSGMQLSVWLRRLGPQTGSGGLVPTP